MNRPIDHRRRYSRFLGRPDGFLHLVAGLNADVVAHALTDALLGALAAEPGEPVSLGRVTAESPRLQDLIDPSVPLEITVHDSFDFWVDGEVTDDVRASLERASAYAHPTVKLASVSSAYWTQMGDKEFLRWVMPDDENLVLDGLARLHVTGEDTLGDGTRCIGMFRAQGVIAPVWELPLGTGADAIEDAAAALGTRLAAAMADTSPLTSDQRRARAGLTTRQVTLR